MLKIARRDHQRYPAWFTGAFLTILLQICLLPAPAAGQQAILADLSLEELDVEVTSASRRQQRAGDVAAAVFVITQDDIRPSGATSVPEVLRMAPGVEGGPHRRQQEGRDRAWVLRALRKQTARASRRTQHVYPTVFRRVLGHTRHRSR